MIPAEFPCLERKNGGPLSVYFTRCNATTKCQDITPIDAPVGTP